MCTGNLNQVLWKSNQKQGERLEEEGGGRGWSGGGTGSGRGAGEEEGEGEGGRRGRGEGEEGEGGRRGKGLVVPVHRILDIHQLSEDRRWLRSGEAAEEGA